MNNTKQYMFVLAVGLPLLLILASLFNFLMDPGNVYLKGIFTRKVAEQYIERLVISDHGMVQEGWGERDVKLLLATKASEYDCVVLGSSHVMSVSSIRLENITGNGHCENLINLGVSGAGLEDVAIFTEVLIGQAKRKSGTKVIIGIDPWLYNFNRDTRYMPNVDKYRHFLSRVGMEIAPDTSGGNAYQLNWISNLISSDYFMQGVALLTRDGVTESIGKVKSMISGIRNPDIPAAKYVMPDFDFDVGVNSAVTLSDGSHVYSKKDKKTPTESDLDASGYKIIDNNWSDPGAIELFRVIVNALVEHGYEVVFLFTPYHHNVWDKQSGHKTRQAMKHVYELTISLARERGLTVLGSYDPRAAGCRGDEFFNYNHARQSCLNRLF